MKKTKFDTSIEGYKNIGINLTEEQYDDLAAINLMMKNSIEDIPVHGIILTLKALGLLPSEIIHQESGDNSNENSYNDSSLRSKLYQDMHKDVRRQFGVGTYKAIKRNQCDKAVQIVSRYEPPMCLKEQIDDTNAQISLNE